MRRGESFSEWRVGEGFYRKGNSVKRSGLHFKNPVWKIPFTLPRVSLQPPEVTTKLGACAMTTKFLDNKIWTLKILLSWRFPRKTAFWTICPLCPQSPPPGGPPLKNENLIFIVVSPSLRNITAIKWRALQDLTTTRHATTMKSCDRDPPAENFKKL